MIKTDYDNLVKWFYDSIEPDFVSAGLSWNDEMMCSVKNNYGAMACAIYSLINTSGPKDFYSKKTVKAFESGIDLHHVFPKKHYDKKINVNLALNMAFLEKTTNESIGSESTVHYSDNIIEEVYENSEAQFKSIMATQLIDDDAYSDFRKEDYASFIKHRMDAIVKKLTSEYGVTVNKIKKENITDEQQSDFEEDQDDETI